MFFFFFSFFFSFIKERMTELWEMNRDQLSHLFVGVSFGHAQGKIGQKSFAQGAEYQAVESRDR
jgi:hypothetical protein